MRRVFVSSTCFDLVDMRAEVRDHLSDAGFTVSMSDVPETFAVDGVSDSIAVCLANLRVSDVVVVILSQRYGPPLRPLGTDLSATHVEYDEAIKNQKPVLFFVRDRLMAVYDAWVAIKKKEIPESHWVRDRERDAAGPLSLIDQHKALKAGKSNWINLFTSSVDLKRALDTQLGAQSGVLLLEKLQREGVLGFLSVAIASTMMGGIQVYVTNNSDDPAMDVCVAVGDPKKETAIGDISPHGTKQPQLSVARQERVFVRWTSLRCGRILDTYAIDGSGNGSLFERRLLSAVPVVLRGSSDDETVY